MKNIVLVGFMGVGKTTIGKRVSAKLKIDFFDTDEAIFRCEKIPVYELLAKKGPKYFEGAQRFAVSTLAQNDGVLISTGGDTVLDSFNLEVLQKNGILFWLDASPETIYKNTRHSVSKRPGLKTASLSDISQMIEERKPFYEKADVKIAIDRDGIDAAVEKIIEEFNARVNQ